MTPTMFITSDTRFCEENAIPIRGRNFENIKEMNLSLIEKWNAEVGPNDVVFHLGNFAIGHPDIIRTILFKLNGNITLIRGEEDPPVDECLDLGFCAVMTEMVLDYRGARFRFTSVPDPLEHRGVINVHGRRKGNRKFGHQRINASVDAWEMAPVSLASAFMQYRKTKYGIPNV